MLLSELLDIAIDDAEGRRVGWVIDVRFRVTRSESEDGAAPPELVGILLNPKNRWSYLGYERRDVRSPRLLASIIRWRNRHTRLVSWSDVQRVDASRVTLRPGYQLHSPTLDTTART
jgi:hypothetical protein